MLPWSKIKKRTTNAKLHGVDLGSVSPKVNVNVVVLTPPPKPNVPRRLIKNVSKLPECDKEISL